MDGRTEQEANNIQSEVEIFIDLHDGRLISAPIAVVRSRKDRYESLVMRPVVALESRGGKRRAERQKQGKTEGGQKEDEERKRKT